MFIPASIFAMMLIISLLPEKGQLLLEYQRSAITQAELWRLISAHLVHLSSGHLWMNVTALLVFVLLYANLITAVDWLAIMLPVAALLSGMIYFLEPDIHAYVGLSGIMHTLFVFAGCRLLAQGQRTEAVIILSLFACKLGWEQIAGALPGSEAAAGGPVLVNAHLYGALLGVCWFMLRQLLAIGKA